MGQLDNGMWRSTPDSAERLNFVIFSAPENAPPAPTEQKWFTAFAIAGGGIGSATIAIFALITAGALNMQTVLASVGIGLLVSLICWLLRPADPVGLPLQSGKQATDEQSSQSAKLARDEIRQLRELLEKAHGEAKAAKTAKQNFIAQINHDIRTPLNHILGFTEIIRQKTYGSLGDARYERYLDDIKGSGEQLLSSFSAILELADLNAGDQAINIVANNCEDLTRYTAAKFKSRAMGAGIDLRISSPQNVMVEADKVCLERILDHLLSNAIKFTHRGGIVSLEVLSDAQAVVFKVCDNGAGMGAEQLAQVTEPFSYQSAERAELRRGNGTGLAVAKSLAELSGGQLQFDSAIGHGTTAALMLPRTREHEETPNAQSEATTWIAA